MSTSVDPSDLDALEDRFSCGVFNAEIERTVLHLIGQVRANSELWAAERENYLAEERRLQARLTVVETALREIAEDCDDDLITDRVSIVLDPTTVTTP